MQYLLLIYQSEAAAKPPSDAAAKAMFAEYAQLTQSIKDSGEYRAGQALQPVATASTAALSAKGRR